jgi:hypothetical protein
MSLDQQNVDRNKNPQYVIRDYTHVTAAADNEPVVFVVSGDQILEVVDDAKKNNKKISAYLVGQRVLDWS